MTGIPVIWLLKNTHKICIKWDILQLKNKLVSTYTVLNKLHNNNTVSQ